MLALAAQRLGTNTFMGSSQISLKVLILALIPLLVYFTGSIMIQEGSFSQQLSWIYKISQFVTYCCVNALGCIDLAGPMLVFYFWISDLKLTINNVILVGSKSQLKYFEEILEDYLKLKHAAEPLCFMAFANVQLLCNLAVYLAFQGDIISSWFSGRKNNKFQYNHMKKGLFIMHIFKRKNAPKPNVCEGR